MDRPCCRTHTHAVLRVLYCTVLQEVEEQKARLEMLLGGRDVQMTLLNELLVRAAYKVRAWGRRKGGGGGERNGFARVAVQRWHCSFMWPTRWAVPTLGP